MHFIKVVIGTKYLSVHTNLQAAKTALWKANFKLTEWRTNWDPQKREKVTTKVADFFWKSKDGNTYHYHKAFKDFILLSLESAGLGGQIETVFIEPDMGVAVEIPLNPEFSPREDQPNWIRFLSTPVESATRILPASTGGGKTASGLYATAIIGRRTAIYVAPKYFGIWTDAIEKFTTLNINDTSDVLLVSGDKKSKHIDLKELIRQGQEDLVNAKYIIISLNAFQNYISNFEDEIDAYHGCRPEDFHRTLGIGCKIEDEAHQWLNFRVISDSFNNIPWNIYLTATLMKESPFLKRVEDKVYPLEDRCPVPLPEKYINMVAYGYQFNPNWNLPSVKSSFGYQHLKLEKFFMKHYGRRQEFFAMLYEALQVHYINPYGTKYKALVYFATKDMVAEFQKYLRKRLPGYKIEQFIGGSDPDTIRIADILISTPKKAGTGTDIPDLICTLNTISVASKAENFQNAGRTRKVKGDDNAKEYFVYVYAKNLEKQVEYHRKRQTDFRTPESLVKTFTEERYHKWV